MWESNRRPSSRSTNWAIQPPDTWTFSINTCAGFDPRLRVRGHREPLCALIDASFFRGLRHLQSLVSAWGAGTNPPQIPRDHQVLGESKVICAFSTGRGTSAPKLHVVQGSAVVIGPNSPLSTVEETDTHRGPVSYPRSPGQASNSVRISNLCTALPTWESKVTLMASGDTQGILEGQCQGGNQGQ